MDSGIIITADNLKRHYKIKTEGFFSRSSVLKALDGISFTIRGGKTLAFVGESGCGKTTLARLVTMIEQPTSGRLEIKGISGTTRNDKEKKELHKLVQIVFQNPYGSLNPRKKIGSILEEPLKINTALSASRRRESAYEMLAKVGLTREQYNRYPLWTYRFRRRLLTCLWICRMSWILHIFLYPMISELSGISPMTSW